MKIYEADIKIVISNYRYKISSAIMLHFSYHIGFTFVFISLLKLDFVGSVSHKLLITV